MKHWTLGRHSGRAKSLQGVESLEDRRMLSATQFDLSEYVLEDGLPYYDGPTIEAQYPARQSPFTYDEVFNLQSKPDSHFTIFIDFDGHITSGTIWNTAYGLDPIIAPPFDVDGDNTSFNQNELERIYFAWREVAEDFAPFDVNVTTRDPGVDALSNSGAGDTTWGARAVVSFDTWADCGCGGFAYLNTFADELDTPTFAFNLGPGVLSETISHEVGHMVGLSHDGDSSNAYYGGHGNGGTSWGSIMGAAFTANVTHWSPGDYFGGNNFEHDLGIITGSNGFGHRADDFGDSIATAMPIGITGGTNVHNYGIIEDRGDRDFFEFVAGAGDLSLSIDILEVKPNLDVFAALYDSTGNLVEVSNESNQLEAAISATVDAGTYYLRVEGVGSDAVYNEFSDTVSDPSFQPWRTSNPSGYPEYGSQGQYMVSGTIPQATNNTFEIAATDAVVTEGTSGQTPLTFTVTRSGATSGPASVEYDVTETLPAFVGDSVPDAASTSDFAAGTSFSGILNFAANETTKTLTFDALGDSEFERDEYFDVTLSNASSGWLIATRDATGTILSDENVVGVSTLSTEDSVNEGPYDGALVRWRQTGAGGVGFDEWAIDNISLTNSTLTEDFDPIDNSNWSSISGGTVSNQFGGTGNALTMNGIIDRRVTTNLLSAAPGDIFTFDIIFGDGSNGGENVDEGEDVILEYSLDGGSNWQIVDTFDSEAYTSWTTVQAELPAGIDTNPPSSVSFEIIRQGGLAGQATIDWVVEMAGSLSADADDFVNGVMPSGQVTFESGESTAAISIPVNGDFDPENDESFHVRLTGGAGSGSVAIDGNLDLAIATIINDDAGYTVNDGSGAEIRLRQLDNFGEGWDNWAIDNVNIAGAQVEDDFEPTIDNAQWDFVVNGAVNNNFGGDGNSLFFDGDGGRSIATPIIFGAADDTIDFDFIYGDDNNGGEAPEVGDDVVLEYSTDGGANWNLLRMFPLNLTTWTSISEPIPVDAVQPEETLDEGQSFTFVVKRIGISSDAITSVPWEVVGSGANPAEASDFVGGVLPSGTINFNPGEVAKLVTVATNDDSTFEADETFNFVLDSAGGSLTTATIVNNDTSTLDCDFDGDGFCGGDDIDTLQANIILGPADPSTYDLTGDGMVNIADRNSWLALAGAANLPSGNPYLLGDANLDGFVDGSDFNIWNNNKFTTNTAWTAGDFSLDGSIDSSDFNAWNNNKFTGSGGETLDNPIIALTNPLESHDLESERKDEPKPSKISELIFRDW